MSRLWERLRHEQNGSIVIIVAFMMTAILGLAALGTDVGRLYVERQRLSSVADAAALSGAQHLPENREKAVEVARSVLTKNGIDLASAAVTVAEDGRHLTVSTERTVPMTFARIFGPDSYVALGDARAVSANLSGYTGAVPLAVPRDQWQIGQQVYLKQAAGNGNSGNYQALALGGNGANTYEENLANGYESMIRIGDWLTTKPGNMKGPTERAVESRIAQDPKATFGSFNRQSPRLVVVPIVKDFEVNGRGEVQVVGFGMFFLEQLSSEKSKGEIVGRFVKFVANGEGSASAPDFGLRTTKLTN